MNRWCAVGIDPGATGAVAVIYSSGAVFVTTVDTKDGQAIVDALPADRGSALRLGVAVEKVTAMVKWPRRTCFSLGQALGVTLGVLVGLDYPTTLVPPKQWQKWVPGARPPSGKEHYETRKEHWRDQARIAFRIPDLNSGEADALWLAWWVARERFHAEVQ